MSATGQAPATTIVKKAVRPTLSSIRLHALNTESFGLIQQSTSVWMIASKEAGTKWRWRAEQATLPHICSSSFVSSAVGDLEPFYR